MIMIGMYGNSVNSKSPVVHAIKNNLIGGVLLFESNLSAINTRKTLSTLCNTLQDASSNKLLIAIDQEGGKVNRLKSKYGFFHTPSAKEVADKHDAIYADSIAQNMVSDLVSCGINVNFAPSVDIHNSNCPVIGKLGRSYSNNPDSIFFYASKLIEAHNQAGICAVIKHFPGHGNSKTDSHKGLTDVTNLWIEEELIPFAKAINEGIVKAIMTAHIVNRKIDKSGLPATLSPLVIQKLLRDSLHYDGVVFSDDMQMHAISSVYGFEESIKKAIQAGIDILVFSNNIENSKTYTPQNIHAAIKKMVLNNDISMDRINESYRRIQSLKISR